MSTFHFCVSGDAVPSARPRTTRTGHVYKSTKSREYETRSAKIIAAQYNQHGGKEPISTGVKLTISEYRRIPQRIRGAEKEQAIMGNVRPVSKPDIDNTVKAVMDSITKAGVWTDDNLVVELIANKFYDELPRVEISIETL